ncbi:MAG: type VII secretion protein EccCa [Micrococcales bacterium]|nr:MAG: type VII secretion protein EccCa [Micrococcales bacterium]
MTTVHFARRPRFPAPTGDTEPLVIRAAPQLREDPPANAMMLLMPAAMLLMVVGFVTIGGFNTTALMMGSMMIVATIGMVVSMRGGNRNTRFETARERRAYLDYLDDARAQVSSARDVQLAAATHSGPSPASLPGLIGGNRMWERRIGDPDYTATRIGTARLPLARPLQVQTPGQGYTPEPTCAGALAQFMANHDSVQNVPVMLRLGQLPELSFSGERQARLGLARSMLLNAATLHGPDALLVVAAADGPGRNEWEWLKWLPHNQHPRLRDALGPRRMILNSLDEVAESLAEELAGRTGREPAGPYRPRQDHPQVGPQIIVVDAARNPAATRTLQQTRIPKALMVAGVSIWHLGGPAGGVGLHCIGDHIQMSGAPDVPATVTADGLSRAAATALARQLAPYRLPAHDRGTRFGDGAELADMLGIADPGGVDAAALWRPRSGAQLLCVPIGVDPAGDLVDLDVKESAQGGYGPHGLVIGATGSGKSELLRTLVMALALGHSPDQLNFVLVDFKGGATFAGLGGLPHTSAVITNLADDLTMVDRMFDALSGELNRRQEVLRDAGNLASVRDYEATRTKGARLDPLPSLLVVCDEFSEMLTQKPEFAELFVQIGRLGRSLGIHLLLASQRLEEGRLRGLDSHLSYRIGLKTFSTHESRTVLGVPDAYELPPLPGAGYLKTDHGMTRFQAGYVSGPYREPSRPRGRAVGGARTPLSFVSDPVQLDALPEPAQPDRSTYEDAGDARGRTVLDVMVGRLRGHGTPARQVWLPPLEPAISLGSLPPAATPPGQLQVPVGIVDLPFEQRRDALVVDFSGAAGHGAVIGGSQSGKSTALRTIVTALALAHTPRQVQLYLIDLGGGSLKAVSGLPHVGGYAVRSAPDYVPKPSSTPGSRCSPNSGSRRCRSTGPGSAARRRTGAPVRTTTRSATCSSSWTAGARCAPNSRDWTTASRLSPHGACPSGCIQGQPGHPAGTAAGRPGGQRDRPAGERHRPPGCGPRHHRGRVSHAHRAASQRPTEHRGRLGRCLCRSGGGAERRLDRAPRPTRADASARTTRIRATGTRHRAGYRPGPQRIPARPGVAGLRRRSTLRLLRRRRVGQVQHATAHMLPARPALRRSWPIWNRCYATVSPAPKSPGRS